MNYYNPQSPWEPAPNKYPEPKKWDPQVPKVITINDLFPRLDRLSIGWSPLLETLKEVTAAKPAYPPYDIVKTDETTNLLQVAVAGFTKEELSVTVEDSVLIIEGKKKDKQKGEVLYRGIAARDFELKLAVAEFWKVTEAKVADGMLTVTFVKELPEEKKPKVIDIQ